MNKKGQALVEFVIILPVFLLIVFAIIDFGIIIYSKNDLENKLVETIELYENGTSETDILKIIKKENNNIDLIIKNDKEENIELILQEKKDLITPGLGLVIDNPYIVTVSRVIFNE